MHGLLLLLLLGAALTTASTFVASPGPWRRGCGRPTSLPLTTGRIPAPAAPAWPRRAHRQEAEDKDEDTADGAIDTAPATTTPRRVRTLPTATTTRRDQLLAGGLLAGAVTATLLKTTSSATSTVAQAATSTPLYMDREVWAPLENYMQEGGRERQSTYSPRFTSYLARLLINYDYASMSWWQRKTLVAPGESTQRLSRLLSSKGFEGTFRELDVDEDTFISEEELRAALLDPEVMTRREKELLAQLQASVNFGLLRYQGKEGVTRLIRILRTEFGINRLGKRQIALLFSLMDNLQPVEAIKQLIAEAENARVVGFNVTYPGFGYDADSPPQVVVSPSPGANVSAVARVKLEPTGRILKVVLDAPVGGFSGPPPKLEMSPPSAPGGVRAVCIPKMNGEAIERVIVSNPGSGYTESDRPTVIVLVDGQPLPWIVKLARPVLEMKVARVELTEGGGGSGYAHDLPIKVEISKPPFPISAAATAKATALLSEPNELILRSWLPPTNTTIPVTGLLPNNLVPKYDPCLERFIISPVEELDPNYCIYFEDEFKVVPSQKFNKYFSFLDGSKARDPVEKERELDASVFLRFALCGALCCCSAHAVLIPLDVVKTKMQASPAKYPTFLNATQRILEEGGPKALLLGAGPTIVGYLVYGAVSFGLTEYFKRLFLEVAGPQYATFYPFAILLLASMSAAFFGAVAVTPFEALRIRSVTSSENSGNDDYDEEDMSATLETPGQSATALEDSVKAVEHAAIVEKPEEEATAAPEPEPEPEPPAPEGLVAVLASVAASGMEGMNNGAAAAAAMPPPLSMAATISQMAKEGSLGELYAGLGPAVVGEIPFMMAKFAVFDAVSKAIYGIYPSATESVGLSLAVSLISGMTAGVAAAVVSHPFDTLTTKVTQYTQMGRKGGILKAVQDIYRRDGLAGYFKGTFPRAVKSAANIAFQFFLYDFSKRALHVSADDLKLFFDVMSSLTLPPSGDGL